MELWGIHSPFKTWFFDSPMFSALGRMRVQQEIQKIDWGEEFLHSLAEMERKELEESQFFLQNTPFSALEQYPIGILLSIQKKEGSELLRITSASRIGSNALLVSPLDGSVVAKAWEVYDQFALFLPIWNHRFFCQVLVHTQDGTRDQAFFEKGKVMNYNTAFSFASGDRVYFSDYEPGGYTVKRYGWDYLGTIGALLQQGVVEAYNLEFATKRDDALQHRHFIIIQ